MRKWVLHTLFVVATIGLALPASAKNLSGELFKLAQSKQAEDDEPTPPDKRDSDKKDSDEPTPPGNKDSDEPTPPGKDGDEPTPPGKGADEPGGKSTDEPGKGVDEPAKPGPTQEELSRKVETPTSYGIGLQFRAHFIHQWFLGMFLDESTDLNAVAFGGEFIRRKGDLDIIGSIDFGLFGPKDGNYLGNNKAAETKTDYVQFRNFNILSFNAHFIWHQELTNWVSFVYGVGVGLGIVLGDMYRISNDPSRCNRENAGDEDVCLPVDVSPETREADIQARGAGPDDPENPHLFKEDDVPPVIPMIHLLVGFSFKINDQLSVRVDGGFRNAFYIGTTGHWFF